MSEDPRCCGSGTCIIDNEGRCWCGQQWDGQKMCHASLTQASGAGAIKGSEVEAASTDSPGLTPRPHRA
jgi:hypothetical protein